MAADREAAPSAPPGAATRGYWTDPDAHLWEIAYAPMFPPDEQGRIEIGTPT